MLDALRKSAASWVAKILFGLLILSFAIWGVGDMLGLTRPPSVATVGDQEISASLFQEEYNREMNRLQRLFNDRFDSQMARQLGVPQQVLQQLVSRQLLSLEAQDLGIAIDDSLILKSLEAEPMFQTAKRFDRVRFEQVLQANGMTEESYIRRLRSDLARAQVSGAVGGISKAPSLLVDALRRYRGETRVAEVMLLRAAEVTDIGEPDDAALIAYHNENKHLFMAPEYRSLTAIALHPDDLLGEIKLSEQQLRESYQNRLIEFAVPERRIVDQILFADEEKAGAAHARIKEGVAFDAVGKSAGETGAQIIEIGEVSRDELVSPEIGDAVFALKEPGVSEPIQSSVGWHLMRVSEIQPSRTRSFDEVRDELEKTLAREQARKSLYALSKELDDELAGGAQIPEAAQRLNLKLISIPASDQQGMNPAGKPVEALPRASNFLTTAFAASEGVDSLLTETPEGGFFVVRVNSVTAPALRPMDAVRADVAAGWKADRRNEIVKETADGLIKRLRSGESVASIAAEHKLETRMSAPFTRDTNNPQGWLPAGLVPALFKAEIGGVEMAPHPDGYVIARLTEIRGVETADATEKSKEIAAQITSAMTADLENQFDETLRQRYGVTLNQRVLESLF